MTYEQEPLTCCCFKSDRIDKCFSGSVEVDGKQYWINLYDKEGKKGQFFSVQLREKKPLVKKSIPFDVEYDDLPPF